MSLDMAVVTTATIRPGILERTYQSFSDNITDIDFKDMKLYLNIDPLPADKLHEIPDVISVAKNFFGEVDVSTPETASFPLAVKRLYEKASNHRYVFDLQDDWLLLRKIEMKDVLKKIYGDQIGVTLNTYNFKKFPFLFCISPTITLGSWVRKVHRHIKPHATPEQQFRHTGRKGIKLDRRFIGKTSKYPNPETIIVKDIGRDWIKGTGYKKKKNNGMFTSWEK